MATPRTRGYALAYTGLIPALLHAADLGLDGGVPVITQVSYRVSVLHVPTR